MASLIGIKGQKGSLIGESDPVLPAGQRLCKHFLFFNTDQKPHVESPKRGICRKKII